MPLTRKIGEGYVEVRAKRDKFKGDLDKARKDAQRGLGKLQASVGNLTKGVSGLTGLIGVGLVAAIGMAVKKAIEHADAINKEARALGLSSEAYQELSFAASQAGVSQSDFFNGIRKFSQSVVDGADGLQTYKRVFDKLGISLKDNQGNMKDTEQLVLEVADSLPKLETGVERVHAAQMLFGRSGARFINLLSEGSKGIERMRIEARNLGIVINGEMLREAEKANDQLDRMGRILQVNVNKVLISFIPLILKAGSALARVAPQIKAAVDSMVPASMASVEEIESRIKQLESIKSRIKGPFGELFTKDLRTGKTISERIEDLKEAREKALAADAAIASMLLTPGGSGEGQKTPLQSVLEDLNFQLEQVGKSDLVKKIGEMTRKAGDISEGDKQGIAALVQAIHGQEQLNERQLKYKNMIADSASEWQKLMDLQRQINLDYELGNLSLDQRNVLLAIMQGKFQELKDSFNTWANEAKALATEAESAFIDAFAVLLVTGEKTFKRLAQSFLIDFVKIAIEKGIYRMLAAMNLLGTGTVAGGSARTVPAYASGGIMKAGVASLVGEKGPELVIPNRSSMVIPNNQIGGGITLNQNLSVFPGVAAMVRQEIENSRGIIAETALTAVKNMAGRGGTFSRAFR